MLKSWSPTERHQRYGNWRRNPDAETEQNKDEIKKAQKEIKEPTFKTAGCSKCEIGSTKQNRSERSTACRQTLHDCGAVPSVWKV